MVILLVNPESQSQCRQGVEGAQQMEGQRGDGPVYDHQAEVLDVAEHRIQQKQPLHRRRIAVNFVKNSGQIGQQGQEYVIQVLCIPEEHIHGRKHHAHPQIQGQQAQHRVSQTQHMQSEGDAVQKTEEEIHHQNDGKIHQSRDIPGENEEIFGNIDLGEDPGIAHEAVHTAPGGLLKIGHDQVAAEQIGGVKGGISSKKLGKYQLHDQQRQQRRKHAPSHAQNGALIFFFKIPFYQLLKEELVFF